MSSIDSCFASAHRYNPFPYLLRLIMQPCVGPCEVCCCEARWSHIAVNVVPPLVADHRCTPRPFLRVREAHLLLHGDRISCAPYVYVHVLIIDYPGLGCRCVCAHVLLVDYPGLGCSLNVHRQAFLVHEHTSVLHAPAFSRGMAVLHSYD